MIDYTDGLHTTTIVTLAARELLGNPRYVRIESLSERWLVESHPDAPPDRVDTETVRGERHDETWRIDWSHGETGEPGVPVDRERIRAVFARLIDTHADPAFSLRGLQTHREASPSYSGAPLSPGVVAAVPTKIDTWELDSILASTELRREIAEGEIVAASRLVTTEIRSLAERSASRDAAAVLEAQALLLESSSFIGAITSSVRDGQSFSLSVSSTVNRLRDRIRGVGSSLVLEKIQDIEDLAMRLSLAVLGTSSTSVNVAGRIVCIDQPQPSTLFQLTNAGAAGIALFDATATSHLAIIASSLPVPTVLFEGNAPTQFAAGPYTLDAESGAFYAGTEASGTKISLPPALELAGGLSLTDTSIIDRPALLANVSAEQDAAIAAADAEGIGLYRTELAWELVGRIPAEDEQCATYRTVFASFAGKPITVRTADIGGDKPIDETLSDAEDNPFLGVRGIRFSLAQRELFRRQLRAILRAGVGYDVRVMLPMVTTPSEIETAREELAIAALELEHDGVEHLRTPKLGIMIETPAAAIYAEELARRVDFFSIGTNDLVMYLMAVDRTNQAVSSLYRTFHPVILRTLDTVAKAAHSASIHVSVCGQAAADPHFLPFLVGIGIDAVSVAPGSLRRTRDIIARLSPALCRGFADRLLSGESLAAVLSEVGDR